MEGRSRAPRSATRPVSRVAQFALTFAAFVGLGLVVYAPALRGPFVSDDLYYVATNPYVHALSLENLRAILDPASPASIFVNNYTPLHLLLHALAWHAFGEAVPGHHVVNVVLHALASTLLVALLVQSGLASAAALGVGTLFLLHPANVEAVAWISQLKTTSCMVLSLLALLAFPRRPALATPLFFLALLAKPTACFVLPVAGVLTWVRWEDGLARRRLAWLALWSGGFALLAVAQIEVNRHGGTPDVPLDFGLLARVRTSLAIAARYLAISATSIGSSTFHEPPRPAPLLDPWFLASLPALLLLAARTTWALRARREEALWWVFAASSFAPVSQIFPFLYPMADRYLYFILPGLLGGTALAAQDALARLRGRGAALASRACAGLVLLLACAFGVQSHARAALWADPVRLLTDSAAHYPDGMPANLLRARRAARAGDAAGAVDALEAAAARGYNHFEELESDPSLASLRDDPRFDALVARLAESWIQRVEQLPRPTQMELHRAARASLALHDVDGAERFLERAIESEGPLTEMMRSELAMLRRQRPSPTR